LSHRFVRPPSGMRNWAQAILPERALMRFEVELGFPGVFAFFPRCPFCLTCSFFLCFVSGQSYLAKERAGIPPPPSLRPPFWSRFPISSLFTFSLEGVAERQKLFPVFRHGTCCFGRVLAARHSLSPPTRTPLLPPPPWWLELSQLQPLTLNNEFPYFLDSWPLVVLFRLPPPFFVLF